MRKGEAFKDVLTGEKDETKLRYQIMMEVYFVMLEAFTPV